MNRHPLWERILRSRPSIEALEDRVLLSHTPLAPEFVVNTNPVAGAVAPPAVATASDATGVARRGLAGAEPKDTSEGTGDALR